MWVCLKKIMLSEISQRESQILYDITYMWKLKKNAKEYICKTEADIENKPMVAKGEIKVGRDKLGVWD